MMVGTPAEAAMWNLGFEPRLAMQADSSLSWGNYDLFSISSPTSSAAPSKPRFRSSVRRAFRRAKRFFTPFIGSTSLWSLVGGSWGPCARLCLLRGSIGDVSVMFRSPRESVGHPQDPNRSLPVQ
jgi:hypothetical protein